MRVIDILNIGFLIGILMSVIGFIITYRRAKQNRDLSIIGYFVTLLGIMILFVFIYASKFYAIEG